MKSEIHFQTLCVVALFAGCCLAHAIEPAKEKRPLVTRLGTPGYTVALAFSSNAQSLFSVSWGTSPEDMAVLYRWPIVKVEKGNDRVIVKTFAPISFLDCDSADKRLVTGDRLGRLKLLAVDGQALKRLKAFELEASRILALKFLPDDEFAAIFSDAILTKWKLNGDAKYYRIARRPVSGRVPVDALIRVAAFSQTGRLCTWYSAYEDGGSLWVWEMSKGVSGFSEILTDLLGREQISRLAISDDGTRVMCQTLEKLILVDVGKKKVLKAFRGHEAYMFSLISLNGNQGFVTGDQAGVIKVWSQDGAELRSITSGDGCVMVLAVDRENRRLATAGDVQPISMWDISSTVSPT